MSESETPIKTPKQLIAAIIAAFLIPIFVIVMLTKYVGNSPSPIEGKNAYTEEATLIRISPIGTLSAEPAKEDAIRLVKMDQPLTSGIALPEMETTEPCTVNISAADNMMFDKKKFNIDSKCDLFSIKFKHIGSMPANAGGHNVVIVETNNFQSVVGKIDMKLGEKTGYLPVSSEIIGRTAIIGGGQEIILKMNTSKLIKGGKYTFFCSFPGHYTMMKGDVEII